MHRLAVAVSSAVACIAILATIRPLGAVGSVTAKTGQPAPNFLVDTLGGGSASNSFGGKPALINVFASWCPPCRQEIPSIVDASKRYAGRVDFLFVDEQEAPSRVKAFAREVGIATPVGIDQGQFAASYGVAALPVSVFIDRNGIVRLIYRGPLPKAVLADELAKLAAR